jgi:hypothetical protein
VVIGLVAGTILGWVAAPTFNTFANPGLTIIGMGFIGAAIGLAIGSFAGMGRAPVARR